MTMKKEQDEAARLGGESETSQDRYKAFLFTRFFDEICTSAAYLTWKAQDAHYAPLLAQRDAEITALMEKCVEKDFEILSLNKKLTALREKLSEQEQYTSKVCDKLANVSMLLEVSNDRFAQQAKELVSTLEKIKSLEERNQRLVEALKLIEKYGGKADWGENDGFITSCNGSWCGEQARSALYENLPALEGQPKTYEDNKD